MRRAGLLILLAALAGVCLAAAGGGKKFPYLSTRWNRTQEVTDFELACLRCVHRSDQPVELLRGALYATEISACPMRTHLRLTVQVKPAEDAPRGVEAMDLSEACTRAAAYWQQSLLKKPLDGDVPVTIDLEVARRVVFRQINDSGGRRNIPNPSSGLE